jgi:hypothetical protein
MDAEEWMGLLLVILMVVMFAWTAFVIMDAARVVARDWRTLEDCALLGYRDSIRVDGKYWCFKPYSDSAPPSVRLEIEQEQR